MYEEKNKRFLLKVLFVATFVGSLKRNNKNHTLTVHLLLLDRPNDL